VVFHCCAGLHRAALTWTIALVFGLGISVHEARKVVEDARAVDLDSIIMLNQRQNGSRTEDSRKYWP